MWVFITPVEVQVGYYHINANDIEEAIAIAKDNPEFEFVPSASIEVRPNKNERRTNKLCLSKHLTGKYFKDWVNDVISPNAYYSYQFQFSTG
ncbi:MAG: hypothetical protein ABJA71_16780 [Ginsengibacter sp.]